MSRRFWTADLHLGHANIAKYARRPWLKPGDLGSDGSWVSQEAKDACALRMNEGLIRNMNGRIKPGDTCVHVGDFCCRGAERQVPGMRVSAAHWRARLEGDWIFIEGNHDRNNGLKKTFKMAVVTVGPYMVGVHHVPLYTDSALWFGAHCLDAIICGHVHDRWAEAKINGLLHINVGVDARRYFPVRDDELVQIINKVNKGGGCGTFETTERGGCLLAKNDEGRSGVAEGGSGSNPGNLESGDRQNCGNAASD